MKVKPTAVSPTVDPAGEFPLAPADYLLHLLASIALFRDAALDGLMRERGLNIGRYRVIGVLARLGACTMGELANFTAMDRTTLTRIADHLVDKGLAHRHGVSRDRRKVVLELTAAGRRAHGPAVRALLAYNRKALEGLDEAALRTAARTLIAVTQNIAPNPAARDAILTVWRPTGREG